NLSKIHVCECVPRSDARSITEAQEALRKQVNVSGRVDVVIEKEETCLDRMGAVCPDQVVFDRRLRVRKKEAKPGRLIKRGWNTAPDRKSRQVRLTLVAGKDRSQRKALRFGN